MFISGVLESHEQYPDEGEDGLAKLRLSWSCAQFAQPCSGILIPTVRTERFCYFTSVRFHVVIIAPTLLSLVRLTMYTLQLGILLEGVAMASEPR